MKSKRLLTIFVVLLCGALNRANAVDATVSVNNEGSFIEHAILVKPEDTFSIDINVSTTEEIFDVVDMKLSAGVDNVLSISGGFIHSPWTSFDAIPVGNLNPVSARFGIRLPDPDMFGPGETTLVTLDVHVASGALSGVYSLNIIDAKNSECRICPAFSNATTGPDFVVEVFAEHEIPALSEWGLVALSIILLTAGTLVLRSRYAASCFSQKV